MLNVETFMDGQLTELGFHFSAGHDRHDRKPPLVPFLNHQASQLHPRPLSRAQSYH